MWYIIINNLFYPIDTFSLSLHYFLLYKLFLSIEALENYSFEELLNVTVS